MRYILSLFTALLLTSISAVEVGPYKVTKVVDGDTIKIQTDLGERTVRILYVDTPETSDDSHGKSMPEGLNAKQYLASLLNSKEVKLWGPEEELEQDRYGRLLAIPLFPIDAVVTKQDNGTSVAQNKRYWAWTSVLLVASGHSPYWRKYGQAPEPVHAKLLAAHNTAKEKKVGAWATANKYMTDKTNERTAPKDQTKEALKQFDDAVVQDLYKKELEKNPENTHWLNENGKVRHNKDCRWFGKTKKGRFCTKDAGKACGQCGG